MHKASSPVLICSQLICIIVSTKHFVKLPNGLNQTQKSNSIIWAHLNTRMAFPASIYSFIDSQFIFFIEPMTCCPRRLKATILSPAL